MYNVPSLAQESETREKPDQLKVNLNKLDSQIQAMNTSLDSGTEAIRKQEFARSIQEYREGLSEHKKRLEKEQLSRNRRSLFKIIGLIVVIVIAIVNRINRKKTDRLIEETLEKTESQVPPSENEGEDYKE